MNPLAPISTTFTFTQYPSFFSSVLSADKHVYPAKDLSLMRASKSLLVRIKPKTMKETKAR